MVMSSRGRARKGVRLARLLRCTRVVVAAEIEPMRAHIDHSLCCAQQQGSPLRNDERARAARCTTAVNFVPLGADATADAIAGLQDDNVMTGCAEHPG